MSWFKLISTRRSTVLSHPLQLLFPHHTDPSPSIRIPCPDFPIGYSFSLSLKNLYFLEETFGTFNLYDRTKTLYKFIRRWCISSVSTMVEHSPRHPKVEDSSLATDTGALRVKMSKKNHISIWKYLVIRPHFCTINKANFFISNCLAYWQNSTSSGDLFFRCSFQSRMQLGNSKETRCQFHKHFTPLTYSCRKISFWKHCMVVWMQNMTYSLFCKGCKLHA
jgi:hypothetical protein